MGQYWKAVNLDKREFVNPHKLGCGLKLWEQLANHPSTTTALLILQAPMPENRGGGDLTPNHFVGRWAGDRVVLVGDYAEDDDIKNSPIPFSLVYSLCRDPEDIDLQGLYERKHEDYPELIYKLPSGKFDSRALKPFTDISDELCEVIEKELNGKFVGSGWRDFQKN
jgi:hypothetical protein